MSSRFARTLGRVAVVAVLLAACSGDDDDVTSSAPPLPTPPASTAPASVSVTVAPPSTVAAPTSTELNPVPTAATFPPTTSPVTVELPPVPTLVPQVSPDLLTPEQQDPNNPHNKRTILPEHVPVVEAHLSAIQANYLVYSTWPIDPDAPELLGSALTPETLARVQESLRGRLARSEVLNVSQGVTFRPYVIGPVLDTATLYDCELAGQYWMNADTGELIPPNEIWPAGPGHVVEVGLRVDMVNHDGRWLVDTSHIDPEACG